MPNPDQPDLIFSSLSCSASLSPDFGVFATGVSFFGGGEAAGLLRGLGLGLDVVVDALDVVFFFFSTFSLVLDLMEMACLRGERRGESAMGLVLPAGDFSGLESVENRSAIELLAK